MKIYGNPVSGNCLKVKWTADRLGVPYRWIDQPFLKGETRERAYLAINPAGQIPAVVLDDGETLAQSNAIMLYLNRRHGGDLLPADPLDEARVLQWLFWEQYTHEPAIAVRRFHKTVLGKDDSQIDPVLLDKGYAALGVMEGALAGRDWFVADRFSAADIALVAYTRLAHEGGFDLSDYENVTAWVRRVETELGLAPAMEVH